jgi:hypothetical protein
MSSITFNSLRINTAEQFKESISEPAPNTKIYIAIGKVEPWANDAAPANANNSIATAYEVWDNMIGGKRLVGSDISHVIPRVNWAANTSFTAYDHMHDHTSNQDFYVLTSQNAVYKCISNNNGQLSTVEPSSFNVEAPISTADGYIWKFMYQISSAELLRFTTQDFIPVKTLTTDDGSLQWQVQNSAREGSIEHIEVTDPGTGYVNVSNLVISVVGDGTPVIATANIANGGIEKIIVTDAGLNYTFASVTIGGGGGFGAQARAIISPPGGHGSNPLYELNGSAVMLDARLRYGEEGVLPITNDYRQVSLIKDPIDGATSNVATIPAFSQMLVITTSGAGTYLQDEIVYQGNSLATASFKGRVVFYDEDTSKVYLINTTGTPTASRSLIGSESFTVRVLASVESPDLVKNSGQIMYLDNIVPVSRSEDQIENFKIVLKF